MNVEITDSEIDKYFSKLSIDKKVALLPKRLIKSFSEIVVEEFYQPYWDKRKNSLNPAKRLTDADITAGREKILREKYLYKKPTYRRAIKESLLEERGKNGQ
jgi:hypothetical protein